MGSLSIRDGYTDMGLFSFTLEHAWCATFRSDRKVCLRVYTNEVTSCCPLLLWCFAHLSVRTIPCLRCAQIEAAFAKAGLVVPPVKEVLAQLAVDAKRAEKLLQMLLREKKLQRISIELVFHTAALQDMRQKLAEYKKAKTERISVPAFKELTGISRKYAIPLLEYLDRERVTRRVGDERVIL